MSNAPSPSDATGALVGAKPEPYWLDDPGRPEALAALAADTTCDLAVVGGGYTGLWTALLAKERDPGRDVVLLEGGRSAGPPPGATAASARQPDPRRGQRPSRFAAEIRATGRLGRRTSTRSRPRWRATASTATCERTGELNVATEPHQVEDWLEVAAETASSSLPRPRQVRAEVDSPTYLAGVWNPHGTAMLDPAGLAWGLAGAAEPPACGSSSRRR